jgi:hypothetical protein
VAWKLTASAPVSAGSNRSGPSPVSVAIGKSCEPSRRRKFRSVIERELSLCLARRPAPGQPFTETAMAAPRDAAKFALKAAYLDWNTNAGPYPCGPAGVSTSEGRPAASPAESRGGLRTQTCRRPKLRPYQESKAD